MFIFLLIPLLAAWSCSDDAPENTPDNREPTAIIPEPQEDSYYEGEAPYFTKVNVFNHDLLWPGYGQFRIPAIITTKQGTLIAFAEMRTKEDDDPKTLVFRRSTDNGATWGNIQLVEEDILVNNKVYGNPTPVVDENNGNIQLIYVETFTGGSSCTLYQRTSTDDGLTWSDRISVPNVVSANWRPVGPGIGIQLKRGQHKGRLIIPGRYSGGGKGNYGMYSDDGGTTWKLGYKSVFGSAGSENETTCTELTTMNGNDAVVYINSRSEVTTTPLFRRLDAYSNNSGETLAGAFKLNKYIKTDRCQGATLRWTAKDMGDPQDRILLSTVSWGKEDVTVSAHSRRRHVGIWSTFDESQTWTPHAKRVQDLKGGYSSMTRTADGYVGIIFEAGKDSYFNEMDFVKVNEGFLDVPPIGAKWDFEDQASGASISSGTSLPDQYTGGTGRPLNATGTISVTAGSTVFKQNAALSFDGTACLKMEDADTWTQFDFHEDLSFTLEAIVKVQKGGVKGLIVGRPYIANYPQWLLSLESDGTASFRIDDDEFTTTVKTKSSITDNKWHHVAAVRDVSSHKVKIYVDGELSNEVADKVVGSLASRRPLFMGGQGDGNNNFIGEIDFVRISPMAISEFLK